MNKVSVGGVTESEGHGCVLIGGGGGRGGNDHIDWQDLTHGRQCAKAMSYVFVGNWSLCCSMRAQSINAIILSRCTISF